MDVMRVFTDLYYDISCKWDSRKSNPPIIWINGLAKSGTSLIEDILAYSRYVEAHRSPYRYCHLADDHKQGNISDYLFDCFPMNKKTFVKSHTRYTERIGHLIRNKNVRVVISIRDICDALVSRYYHVLSDSRHWQYQSLNNTLESEHERFLRSIQEDNPETGISSAEYYAKWVSEWIGSPYRENIVRYEDYINDPMAYIDKVGRILGIDIFAPDKIEDMLEKKRAMISSASSRLWVRRLLFRNRSGTFRSGTCGSYKELRSKASDMILISLKDRYLAEA